MRATILALSSAFLLAAGAAPALAQLSGGVGSSNAANRAFQQQNTVRGIQQQQTFNSNQNRLQTQTNQMNAGAGNTGAYVAPRRRHRHR